MRCKMLKSASEAWTRSRRGQNFIPIWTGGQEPTRPDQYGANVVRNATRDPRSSVEA
ncbi:hypothetical protein C8Q70DRAFT_1036454 [Cubamyces menziesii]|nr:hypothetical protein C8Q70DRAFT_1036454 [Cubamyces menziesii]